MVPLQYQSAYIVPASNVALISMNPDGSRRTRCWATWLPRIETVAGSAASPRTLAVITNGPHPRVSTRTATRCWESRPSTRSAELPFVPAPGTTTAEAPVVQVHAAGTPPESNDHADTTVPGGYTVVDGPVGHLVVVGDPLDPVTLGLVVVAAAGVVAAGETAPRERAPGAAEVGPAATVVPTATAAAVPTTSRAARIDGFFMTGLPRTTSTTASADPWVGVTAGCYGVLVALVDTGRDDVGLGAVDFVVRVFVRVLVDFGLVDFGFVVFGVVILMVVVLTGRSPR